MPSRGGQEDFRKRAAHPLFVSEPPPVIGIKRGRFHDLFTRRSTPESNKPSRKMIKTVCILLFVAALASAGLVPAAPLAVAPAVAAVPAPIVTARSSQVVARNYNTLAAAPLAAALPAAVAAPLPAAYPPVAVAAAPLHAAPLPYAALNYPAVAI
ncbi:large ribosomal subunit protein eL22-like [Apis cerana]|uniref:large ribosomal subunit protein eL22-like n=1 Tax=Apis cerana TaxID=7461 RepID=UPI0007E2AAA9|nr:large ribosomal subunit protein eL22-like [Apis cerana]